MAKASVITNVRAHVAAAGWSGVDLAKRLKWRVFKAQRVLNGSQRLTADDLVQLAKALEKSVSEIVQPPAKSAA